MRDGSNWTTTAVGLWQIDCETFLKEGRPFELLEVSTDEHRRFVKAFVARYDVICHFSGTTVFFEPVGRRH